MPEAPARLTTATTAEPERPGPEQPARRAGVPGQERQRPGQRQEEQQLVGRPRARSRSSRPRAATRRPRPRRRPAAPAPPARRAPPEGRGRWPCPPRARAPPRGSPPDTSRAGSIRRCWGPGRATARAPGSRAGAAGRRAAPRARRPGATAPAACPFRSTTSARVHQDRLLNSSNRRFQPKHSIYRKRGTARRRNRSIPVWRNEKGEGMMIREDPPGRGRKPLRVSQSVLSV